MAALGVYGLFSWSVALRTRELAIRLTFGAQPARVGGLVIRQSAGLVVAGIVVGLVIIRLAESALTRVLFEVSPSDVGSMAAAGVLLLVAAIVACAPPDSRDARGSCRRAPYRVVGTLPEDLARADKGLLTLRRERKKQQLGK